MKKIIYNLNDYDCNKKYKKKRKKSDTFNAVSCFRCVENRNEISYELEINCQYNDNPILIRGLRDRHRHSIACAAATKR